MWFRDKREKEQQRLCNIQRDDDAVTSQTPQEPTTSNAGDALRKNPSYHQSVHRRIMKCMCDYKSKEETVLHLLDQYDQHMLVPVKVEGVKISPEPVVSGEDISGGRVVIKVSYFGFHVPIFMTSVMRHAV
ncbi:unnamed protein product [Brassica oleracea var. botrytis]